MYKRELKTAQNILNYYIRHRTTCGVPVGRNGRRSARDEKSTSAERFRIRRRERRQFADRDSGEVWGLYQLWQGVRSGQHQIVHRTG